MAGRTSSHKSEATSKLTRPGISMIVMVIVAIIFVGLGFLAVQKAFDSAIEAGDKQNESGSGAVIKGFVQGDSEGMRQAIQNNANNDYFIEAIKENDAMSVRLLLEEGVNVNQRNSAGATPLHRVTSTGNLEIAKMLIENQANAEAKTKNGSTPLHTAVMAPEPSAEMVTLILDQWVNVDEQDNFGKTALHFAAEKGNVEITQILIEDYEADVNIKDNNGNTPIKSAKQAISENKAPAQQLNKTIQLIQAKGGK